MRTRAHRAGPARFLLDPAEPVARQQRERFRRPPGSGRVGVRLLAQRLPALDDRIGPVPGGFQLVAPHEVGQAAAHHVHQQAFVGFGAALSEAEGSTLDAEDDEPHLTWAQKGKGKDVDRGS